MNEPVNTRPVDRFVDALKSSSGEDVVFPVFMTLDELRHIISIGVSESLWHKINNAISILERGEPCCEDGADSLSVI